MFVYRKRLSDEIPEPVKNTNKFKVFMEDVLLTYQGYEIKGKNVIVTYSISYFNIPQNVKEYEIDKYLDFDSLRKVIVETVDGLGRFITIDTLTSKQLKIVFDAKRFVSHASYPCKIVNQRKIYQTVLKLNQPLPEVIRQLDGGDISNLLSSIMTTMVRNDRKYRYIFSHMNSWAYSKSAVLEAIYNIQDNSFFIEIKDPFRRTYYYYTDIQKRPQI